jgi:alpha-galactosidase
MLVVGRLGWGGIRDNQLTRDEQVTHISMWAILAAPLLIGCDMTQLDDFTLRLLCNDEVLAVNQDPLGKQGQCIREVRRLGGGGHVLQHEAVYVRRLEGGDMAVGLFNRGLEAALIEVSRGELRVDGDAQVRDLWAREGLGTLGDGLALGVPSHGAQLVRITA